MVTMLVATATRMRSFKRLRIRGTSHSPMLTLSMPLATAMSETSHPQATGLFHRDPILARIGVFLARRYKNKGRGQGQYPQRQLQVGR
jgi:hypothetical protein